MVQWQAYWIESPPLHARKHGCLSSACSPYVSRDKVLALSRAGKKNSVASSSLHKPMSIDSHIHKINKQVTSRQETVVSWILDTHQISSEMINPTFVPPNFFNTSIQNKHRSSLPHLLPNRSKLPSSVTTLIFPTPPQQISKFSTKKTTTRGP